MIFNMVKWFNDKSLIIKSLMLVLTITFLGCGNKDHVVCPEEDASQFVLVTDVVPDVILEIRYFSTYNFIGERVPGYLEPIAVITRQAADSLKKVSEDLRKQGYCLKVFDAYRPQIAVDYFMKWANDLSDTRMKDYFYPELDKSVLVPQNYIAEKSGHTRGSTIDLTLFDMRTGKDVDMGCTFDYFGVASHPDVLPGQEIGTYQPINEEQYANRMILRKAMTAHGFKPYECEWWHFTLADEPFPSTYFMFPLCAASLKK
ncbi:MAG: M15 family metallopeptidase [Candidatus Limimorpha sp.]